MIRIVAEKTEQLAQLCEKYRVKQLDVFGSAATGDAFDPQSSDLDFLVQFQRTDEMNVADQYFGLWQQLQELFGRDVDLLTARSLRNPYFIKAVNATRKVVYVV